MPPPTVVTAQAPGVKIVINYCLATYIIHGVRNITDSTPTCWNESSKMLVLLTVILTWLGRALDCKQNRVIILTVKIKVLLQWYSWVHTYIHTVLKKQCRTVSRLQGTPIGECKIMQILWEDILCIFYKFTSYCSVIMIPLLAVTTQKPTPKTHAPEMSSLKPYISNPL